jgi:hypothetical protein
MARLSRSDRTCPYCGSYVPEPNADRHLDRCRAKAKAGIAPIDPLDDARREAEVMHRIERLAARAPAG